MKCILLIAACGMLAFIALVDSSAGRELTEREMWLTFGGFPNDKFCAYNWACDEDPNNDCDRGDGLGWAYCSSLVHDVGVTHTNMNHCTGFATDWQCDEFTPEYTCLTQLECDYKDGDCSQVPFPGGWIPPHIKVPDVCVSEYQGM